MGHTEDGPPEADQKMFLVEVDIPATETTQGMHQKNQKIKI